MNKHPPFIPDEEIRPLAERLSKQRPWLSPEENWIAAERALRQKPWRPWVIRFSGEKERSGWDWADLILKVSVPVLILGLSTAYSIMSSFREEQIAKADKQRQELIAREQGESEVIRSFIKEMQPLLLDNQSEISTEQESEAGGIAKAMTLAALSQVEDPERKRLIIRFLSDSGFNANKMPRFRLSEANLNRANLNGGQLAKFYLRGANLKGANLSEAYLHQAYLRQADLQGANITKTILTGADLTEANLRGANLRGANLREADLRGANLEKIKWDEKTSWPDRSKTEGAKNIPEALKWLIGP